MLTLLARGNIAAIACAAAVLTAGCGGGTANVPEPRGAAARSAASLSLSPPTWHPAPPPVAVPRLPSSANTTTNAAAHPAFFSGEVALSNGVYYLALPNGNAFGYYSYLPDARYIYHFDLGYEYVLDANDGVGGLYLYDFASADWWYTGRQYSFPYVYDFALSAYLYYYPDANNAGHYTTNPRYFYNFTTGAIIMLPRPVVLSTSSLQFDAAGVTSGAIDITPPKSGSYGSMTAATSNAAVATATLINNNRQLTVTSVAPGSATITVVPSDRTAAPATLTVQVQTTTITPQGLRGRSEGHE